MRVQQAFMDRAQERIVTGGRHLHCAVEVTARNGVKRLVQRLGVRPAAETGPPECALDDHHEGGEKREQNRPHDRTAFEEEVHDNIGE